MGHGYVQNHSSLRDLSMLPYWIGCHAPDSFPDILLSNVTSEVCLFYSSSYFKKHLPPINELAGSHFFSISESYQDLAFYSGIGIE